MDSVSLAIYPVALICAHKGHNVCYLGSFTDNLWVQFGLLQQYIGELSPDETWGHTVDPDLVLSELICKVRDHVLVSRLRHCIYTDFSLGNRACDARNYVHDTVT